jgi:PhnB protein
MARKKVKAKAKAKAKRPAAKRKVARKRVPPIPKGFHTLTPYMTVERCNDALQFYRDAFGAKLLYVLSDSGGRIGHAEMRIGDSIFMLADPFPDWGVFAPKPGDTLTFRLHLSVKDVDAFVARAVKAGATVVRPVEDQFYGMRSGTIADPYGYTWIPGTQIEAVSPKEMQKRWNKMMSAPKEKAA